MASDRGASVTAVALRSVAVEFGATVALADISLDVRFGSSLALIGPNGSGKTTLLDLIADVARPTQGEVHIADDARPVAYVLQRRAHHRWMPLTVAEVVRMGRYGERGLLGRLDDDDRAAIAHASQRLEVDTLATRQFGELSGGQQQRVLVAQALAQRPNLLCMDEPITGLDLASQERILDVIGEEVDAGRTVVFSTHHLDEADHCDRVVVLAGRVVAEGEPSEVLTAEVLTEAFAGRVLRLDRGAPPADDVVVLDDHGHGDEH